VNTKGILETGSLFCSLCRWGCGGFGGGIPSSFVWLWVTERAPVVGVWGRGPASSSYSRGSDDSKEYTPSCASLQKPEGLFAPTSEEKGGWSVFWCVKT